MPKGNHCSFSMNGNIVAHEAALGRLINISGANLFEYIESSR